MPTSSANQALPSPQISFLSTPSNTRQHSTAFQPTLVSPSSVTEALNRTQASPSRTSALRDRLETSPSVSGIAAYGLSGPLELQGPPQAIRIQRPLPTPNLISEASPAYPDSSATSAAHSTLSMSQARAGSPLGHVGAFDRTASAHLRRRYLSNTIAIAPSWTS